MTEEKIQALVVQYNKLRPHRMIGGERLNTWCPTCQFDMLQVIIEDLEPIGFTNFRYDNNKDEWASFIICDYGPMTCRIDLSICTDNSTSSQASLNYLRPSRAINSANWGDNQVEFIHLCKWSFERSGNAFCCEDIHMDRLLVGWR